MAKAPSFPKGNTASRRYRRKLAEYLNGKPLKCVTERVNGVEEVIGKSGAIIVRNGELLLFSGGNVVFRTNVDDLRAWELMSLDGVVITAPDTEHGGEERSVIAFYSYWRPLENA